MYAACGQRALEEQGIAEGSNGLVGATEPAKVDQVDHDPDR